MAPLVLQTIKPSSLVDISPCIHFSYRKTSRTFYIYTCLLPGWPLLPESPQLVRAGRHRLVLLEGLGFLLSEGGDHDDTATQLQATPLTIRTQNHPLSTHHCLFCQKSWTHGNDHPWHLSLDVFLFPFIKGTNYPEALCHGSFRPGGFSLNPSWVPDRNCLQCCGSILLLNTAPHRHDCGFPYKWLFLLKENVHKSLFKKTKDELRSKGVQNPSKVSGY